MFYGLVDEQLVSPFYNCIRVKFTFHWKILEVKHEYFKYYFINNGNL